MVAKVVTLYALFQLTSVLFVVLQQLTAQAMGFAIVRVAVGAGPRVLRFARAGVEYVLAAVPLGAYVQIAGWNDPDHAQAPKPKRLVVILTPWLAMLALSACVLGVARVLASAATAWPQTLAGVYPSFGGGAALIARFMQMLEARPIEACAVFMVKMALFNLFPWPSLSGGHALIELLPVSTRVRNMVATLGLLVVLLVFWPGWVISLYRYVAAPSPIH